MQAQLSTAFSRIVAATNAVNAKAASLSTGLSTTNSTVNSLSTSISSLGGGSATPKEIVCEERQAQGVVGGSCVAGFQTRTLNTVVSNSIAGASLSANLVTLPGGFWYRVRATAPAFKCYRTFLTIFDATAGAEVARGQVYFNDAVYNGSSLCEVEARFYLLVTSQISISHYTQQALSTYGLGLDSVSGIGIFSRITVRQE